MTRERAAKVSEAMTRGRHSGRKPSEARSARLVPLAHEQVQP